VRAEHDTALEPEEQVLADRLDRFERPAIDALRDPFGLRAGVRGLRLDALADERLEAAGGSVKRVTLWHVRNANPSRQTCEGARAPDPRHRPVAEVSRLP
jgi:hypothetical protein